MGNRTGCSNWAPIGNTCRACMSNRPNVTQNVIQHNQCDGKCQWQKKYRILIREDWESKFRAQLNEKNAALKRLKDQESEMKRLKEQNRMLQKQNNDLKAEKQSLRGSYDRCQLNLDSTRKERDYYKNNFEEAKNNLQKLSQKWKNHDCKESCQDCPVLKVRLEQAYKAQTDLAGKLDAEKKVSADLSTRNQELRH